MYAEANDSTPGAGAVHSRPMPAVERGSCIEYYVGATAAGGVRA